MATESEKKSITKLQSKLNNPISEPMKKFKEENFGMETLIGHAFDNHKLATSFATMVSDSIENKNNISIQNTPKLDREEEEYKVNDIRLHKKELRELKDVDSSVQTLILDNKETPEELASNLDETKRSKESVEYLEEISKDIKQLKSSGGGGDGGEGTPAEEKKEGGKGLLAAAAAAYGLYELGGMALKIFKLPGKLMKAGKAAGAGRAAGAAPRTAGFFGGGGGRAAAVGAVGAAGVLGVSGAAAAEGDESGQRVVPIRPRYAGVDPGIAGEDPQQQAAGTGRIKKTGPPQTREHWLPGGESDPNDMFGVNSPKRSIRSKARRREGLREKAKQLPEGQGEGTFRAGQFEGYGGDFVAPSGNKYLDDEDYQHAIDMGREPDPFDEPFDDSAAITKVPKEKKDTIRRKSQTMTKIGGRGRQGTFSWNVLMDDQMQSRLVQEEKDQRKAQQQASEAAQRAKGVEGLSKFKPVGKDSFGGDRKGFHSKASWDLPSAIEEDERELTSHFTSPEEKEQLKKNIAINKKRLQEFVKEEKKFQAELVGAEEGLAKEEENVYLLLDEFAADTEKQNELQAKVDAKQEKIEKEVPYYLKQPEIGPVVSPEEDAKMMKAIQGMIESDDKKDKDQTKAMLRKLPIKELQKAGAKLAGGVAKSAAKKIPGIGLLAGGGFAIDKLLGGHPIEAGMELASGAAATFFPGPGTAASIGIDAVIATMEADRGMYGTEEGSVSSFLSSFLGSAGAAAKGGGRGKITGTAAASVAKTSKVDTSSVPKPSKIDTSSMLAQTNTGTEMTPEMWSALKNAKKKAFAQVEDEEDFFKLDEEEFFKEEEKPKPQGPTRPLRPGEIRRPDGRVMKLTPKVKGRENIPGTIENQKKRHKERVRRAREEGTIETVPAPAAAEEEKPEVEVWTRAGFEAPIFDEEGEGEGMLEGIDPDILKNLKAAGLIAEPDSGTIERVPAADEGQKVWRDPNFDPGIIFEDEEDFFKIPEDKKPKPQGPKRTLRPGEIRRPDGRVMKLTPKVKGIENIPGTIENQKKRHKERVRRAREEGTIETVPAPTDPDLRGTGREAQLESLGMTHKEPPKAEVTVATNSSDNSTVINKSTSSVMMPSGTNTNNDRLLGINTSGFA